MSTFKFNDYDCIGFDLDNTLLRYNITNMVKLEYETLSRFLVEDRNYDPKYLLKPLLHKDLDFMQKNLILDLRQGNILKIAPTGAIHRASHGTKFLSCEEILEAYPNGHWDVGDAFCADMLSTWNGPMSEHIRALLDYFDIPTCVAFSRIVDTLDEENGRSLESYDIWPDILDGIFYMFKREHFALNKGGWFRTVKSSPEKYLHKCHPQVLEWMKKLRGRSKLFLLTGSNFDFADFTASYAIGEDWRSLFDIVVCYARKPGFFTGNAEFYTLNGYKEETGIRGNELQKNQVYSQGNWKDLAKFLGQLMGKSEPKCLYIGDNLIQDVYVPCAFANIDTIAVVDEQLAEKMQDHDLSHLDEDIVNSQIWGSYFATGQEDTLPNHIIKNYAKLCVPKLDVFIDVPIDRPLPCFDGKDRKSCGYFPAKPVTAI